MPALSSNSNRLQRSCVVILPLSLLIASVVVADAYRRNARVAELAEQLHAAGGFVNLEDVAADRSWKRLWQAVRQLRGSREARLRVDLPGGLDDNWLRSHDDLTDLRIEKLSVDATSFGDELASMVKRHPLKSVRVSNARNADRIAGALATSSDLALVTLRETNLSDTGLRDLPLEQLYQLDVSFTDVTPDGLRALRRCSKLEDLWIDGRQFAPGGVLDLLKSCPRLYAVFLVGPDVTADSLQSLAEERAHIQGSGLENRAVVFFLEDSSVTQEEVDEVEPRLRPWAVEIEVM